MLIKRYRDIHEFCAGDGSLLREFLHPDKEDLNIRYSFARARVAPGRATQKHRLKGSEVYYILDGRGRMHIGAESEDVDAGACVYIPPGAVQYIQNTGSSALEFICIVDPAWRGKDEEILR